MQDIEYIKVELNNKNGNLRKLRFTSIEQMNSYFIEKYQINDKNNRND